MSWLLSAAVAACALAFPSPASAHNCSSQADCEDTAGYLTAVAVTGGLVAVASGLLGGSVAAGTGTIPPGSGPGGPGGPSTAGGARRPLVDPDTGEALIVQDGSYEGGEPGQVWSPWEGWVDWDTAAQHVRERQAELDGRQREIDDFNQETERQSEARRRENEAASQEAAARAREEAGRQQRLADLRRRGAGLIDRVEDPVRAQQLEDFLDRHRDDPDALERAVGAIRSQTYGAQQQVNMGEAESAAAEGEAYGRSEVIASRIETAARAGVAATGGALLAAGAATAAAVSAGAAATGAIGAAGAGSESYSRGDSLLQGAANTAAGGAIGALEGAVAVGAQAASGAAQAGIRMVGGGLADAADHARRTGDMQGAAVQGAIGVVFGAADSVLPGGAAGAPLDAGAAALEGGMRSSARGGDFGQGAQDGLTNWVVGRAGSRAAGGVARGASGTGLGGGRAPSPGTGTSSSARPPLGEAADVPGEAAGGIAGASSRTGAASGVGPGPRIAGADPGDGGVRPSVEGADAPTRPADGTLDDLGGGGDGDGPLRPSDASAPDDPAPRPEPGGTDDLDAFLREQERRGGGSTDLDVVDPNDPRSNPDWGDDGKIEQGRGASAEEANRREVWLREDGTPVIEPNPEDSLGRTESRIRVDPDTGEARVVHGPDVPAAHRRGIANRLLGRNRDRIQQTLDDARARNDRIRAQQDLAAARQRLADAEARVQAAEERLGQTPEDSDEYLPNYWDRADAQGDKTLAERAELEARMRADEAGAKPDDSLDGGSGTGPKFGSNLDADGRYDLDADNAMDPLDRYATGEPIPGFVPQVRPKDCSIAVMTRETGLSYEDAFQNMKDFLKPERDAQGNLQYGGLPPSKLGAAMERMGIAGDPVQKVLQDSGPGGLAQRLQKGDRFMTGMWRQAADGTMTDGHAIIIDGVASKVLPDGTTQWVLRGVDPFRGRIEIPASEAQTALGGLKYAHFIEGGVGGDYTP